MAAVKLPAQGKAAALKVPAQGRCGLKSGGYSRVGAEGPAGAGVRCDVRTRCCYWLPKFDVSRAFCFAGCARGAEPGMAWGEGLRGGVSCCRRLPDFDVRGDFWRGWRGAVVCCILAVDAQDAAVGRECRARARGRCGHGRGIAGRRGDGRAHCRFCRFLMCWVYFSPGVERRGGAAGG
jgi:hypothetical protein